MKNNINSYLRKKQNMLISIIIPVYNCEKYISEAIQSILNQTYKPIEVIVIDDGSTDNTAKIAKKFTPDIKYIYQPKSGSAAARNRGIKIANGDAFAFLDADDIWIPNKLTLQSDAIRHDNSINIVSCYVQEFLSPEINDPQIEKKYCSQNPMPGYSSIAMLITRETFFQVGLFKENLPIAAFIDWFSRAKEKKLNIKILPDILAKRRIHKNNKWITSSSNKKSIILGILKESIDRNKNI